MSKKGRPTLLNKHIKEIAAGLAKEPGMTLAKLASILRISRVTLYLYLQKDTDFLNAIQSGMDMADELVEISLFRKATGYSHPEEKIFCTPDGAIRRAQTVKHYPPSDVAAQFWLRNRKPDKWRDKIESDENTDIPIVIASDEQNL